MCKNYIDQTDLKLTEFIYLWLRSAGVEGVHRHTRKHILMELTLFAKALSSSKAIFWGLGRHGLLVSYSGNVWNIIIPLFDYLVFLRLLCGHFEDNLLSYLLPKWPNYHLLASFEDIYNSFLFRGLSTFSLVHSSGSLETAVFYVQCRLLNVGNFPTTFVPRQMW